MKADGTSAQIWTNFRLERNKFFAKFWRDERTPKHPKGADSGPVGGCVVSGSARHIRVASCGFMFTYTP